MKLSLLNALFLVFLLLSRAGYSETMELAIPSKSLNDFLKLQDSEYKESIERIKKWNSYNGFELGLNVAVNILSLGSLYVFMYERNDSAQKRAIHGLLISMSKEVLENINSELKNTKEGLSFIDQFGAFVSINYDTSNGKLRSLNTASWSFRAGKGTGIVRAIDYSIEEQIRVYDVSYKDYILEVGDENQ